LRGSKMGIAALKEVQRLQRYRLLLSWLGTSYHGWVSNTPDTPTVQGALQRVLGAFLVGNRGELSSKFAPDVVHICSRVQGCSRTDAGVHALGAVAHIDLPVIDDTPYRPFAVQEGLNYRLRGSEDIQVLDARPVESSFNARHTAGKRYVYSCAYHSLKGGVLFDKQLTLHLPYDLDLAAMQEASTCFEGTHDFSSFRASGCSNPTPVRDITKCEVVPVQAPLVNSNSWALKDVKYFNVVVEGKGFLYRQVRKIVAALLQVGRGRWSEKDIVDAFAKKEPAACPFVAPPEGLTLASVWYEDDEGVEGEGVEGR